MSGSIDCNLNCFEKDENINWNASKISLEKKNIPSENINSDPTLNNFNCHRTNTRTNVGCEKHEVDPETDFDSDSDADAEDVINQKQTEYVEPPDGIVLNNKHFDSINIDRNKPNIASLSIQNSAHPMFGNKTFYKGNITVNHYVKDTNKLNKSESHGNVDAKYVQRSPVTTDQNIDLQTCENLTDKPGKKIPCIFKKSVAIAATVFGISVLSLVIFLILVNGKKENNEQYISESLRIILRDEWNATPPINETKLELPSIFVIISHTVTPECTVKSSCAARVKKIQNLHMLDWQWNDIGYNFLVGGDGAVYVGRGWDDEGAHTLGHNKRSIGIAFIGDFTKKTPPKRQLNAAQNMIAEGLKIGKIRADYELYGQCQLTATDSPGDVLYEIIKKWNNWKVE